MVLVEWVASFLPDSVLSSSPSRVFARRESGVKPAFEHVIRTFATCLYCQTSRARPEVEGVNAKRPQQTEQGSALITRRSNCNGRVSPARLGVQSPSRRAPLLREPHNKDDVLGATGSRRRCGATAKFTSCHGYSGDPADRRGAASYASRRRPGSGPPRRQSRGGTTGWWVASSPRRRWKAGMAFRPGPLVSIAANAFY